ncbi:hypothetical protein C1701_13615 [Actinoalloteichus sp. AHMU CJ021]|uniref:alpha/beta hydrolase n=1 Tax=Actinoalloteichus sp. AHMU CJ021 TaxID=2072503 RepID=UPI000CA05995|nr:hypothetical protein C1701_13615 [Actinoalloteichus sp. AHMU CJ021]
MGRLRSLFGTMVVAAAAVGSSSALDATPTGDLVAPPPGTVEWAAERTEAGDRTPAPGAGTPSEVSEFFARLDGDETDRLAREHPGVVGNLDGVPVDVRLDANERALRQALSEVEARASDGELIGERRREAADRAEVYRDLLAGDRRFLVFDPRGRGLVAEVFGDVEDADSVTVLVPGNDSDLDGFDQPTAPTRSAARAGEALFTEQRARHPEVRTAVIAWSGYVSPRGLGLDAATATLAEAGAVRLERLLAGLATLGRDAGTPPTAHLVCHSYGSVVCSLAARRGDLDVGSLVAVGSPGLRAETAAELSGANQVWATRADDDWIGWVAGLSLGGLGHGTDPTEPSFGARLIPTGTASGHDGYFVPGTESLGRLAEITVAHGVGVPGRTTPDAP